MVEKNLDRVIVEWGWLSCGGIAVGLFIRLAQLLKNVMIF